MLKLVSQNAFSEQLPYNRKKNSEIRNREHLAEHEVDSLIKAAKNIGRHGNRDATLILMMYHHALRVSEAVSLKWEQLDFTKGFFHVVRLKGGIPSTHYLSGLAMRMLRRIRRDYPEDSYVFCGERQGPLSARAAHKIVARAGRNANFPFSIHPHMLRHSAGFSLADDGEDIRGIQAYMGHSSISNTVRYTHLSTKRFRHYRFCKKV